MGRDEVNVIDRDRERQGFVRKLFRSRDSFETWTLLNRVKKCINSPEFFDTSGDVFVLGSCTLQILRRRLALCL